MNKEVDNIESIDSGVAERISDNKHSLWEKRDAYFKVLKSTNEILALLNTKHGVSPYSPYVTTNMVDGAVQFNGLDANRKLSFVDVKSLDQKKSYKSFFAAVHELEETLCEGKRIGDLSQNELENYLGDAKNYTDSMKKIIKEIRKLLVEIEEDRYEYSDLHEYFNDWKHSNIRFNDDYTWRRQSLIRGLYTLMGKQRIECFDKTTQGYLELTKHGREVITQTVKEMWKEYKKRGIHDCSNIFNKDHIKLIESPNRILSEAQIIDIIEDLSSDNNKTKEQRENQGLFMNMVVVCFDATSDIPYMEALQVHDMIAMNFDKFGLDGVTAFGEIRVKKPYSFSVKGLTKPENGIGTDLLGVRTIIDPKKFATEEERNQEVVRQFEHIVSNLQELGKKENLQNGIIESMTIKNIEIANKGVLPKGEKLNGKYTPSTRENTLKTTLANKVENGENIVGFRKKEVTQPVQIKIDVDKALPNHVQGEQRDLIKEFVEHFDVGKTGSNGDYSDSKIVVELEVTTAEGVKRTLYLERQVIWADNDNLVGPGNHCNLERQKAQNALLRQAKEVKGEKLFNLGMSSLIARADELEEIKDKINEKKITGKPVTYYTEEQYKKENNLDFTGIEGQITEFSSKNLPKEDGEVLHKLAITAESLLNNDIAEQRIVWYASKEELGITGEMPLTIETEMPSYNAATLAKNIANLSEEESKNLEERINKERQKKFRGRNVVNNLLLGAFDPDYYIVIPHPSKPNRGLGIQSSALAYMVGYQEHAGNNH